jgi:DTW domain-containing protein YfiP
MSDYNNAVLRLRRQRLARSTKPFLARGSRVIRCDRCLLAKKFCICHTYRPQQSDATFCLLMYDTEPMKPSNTGRLIADILPSTQAFQWSRTLPDPALLALLQDQRYQPYVIFPAAYSEPSRVISSLLASDEKLPLFVILDGTWPEACKMFRKSPYLNGFPVLSFTPEMVSNYQLRESANQQQLCTVEVAVELLRLAGDVNASARLLAHFNQFRQHYLAGKANRSRQKPTI